MPNRFLSLRTSLLSIPPLLLFGLWLPVAFSAPAEGNAESSPSPFGIGACHIHNRSVKDYERWIPPMEEIGIRVIRTPNTSWSYLEPEKGKWRWENLDEQTEYLAGKDFESAALLIGNPTWNTLDPRGNLPVNNLAGWSNYVTKLVTHLKGKMRQYEVWNEPPNFTGKDQTPADYSKIVVAAYEAAKAADPDCLVGLAAKSAHIHYLEETILAGAKDHFDYIVLHPYEILDGIAADAGTEAVFMNIVPVVRKMLAKRSPAKVDVPVVFTELGVSSEKGLDVQAHALIKAYTMGIAQGVECIHWFEGRDGDSGPLGLIDKQGVARPAYHAMASMIQHLGQNPKTIGWAIPEEGHYAFIFQRAAGPVMVKWTHGVAPTFVFDVPKDLIEQAKENRSKPFPWGGDYTGAEEVSIEFGEKTTERGLHTRSGAQLAEAVVAYGGSARSGTVPGGNVFIVDPNFLSYEQTPIEIEVVVRRNPANDNSGFKLVYESAEGFKSAGGWYTVPGNKEWHTKTWRVDDPKFVNYWGYNFILESDGNRFNNYLIRSVTVRKVAP